jgi:CPA2 family monovalent cation:H+ antiporter-2
VACLYGDAAHPHLLEAAGVAHAALIVMTLPDAGHARLAVARIRAINPRVPVLARAHRRDVGDSLRVAGATVVVEPELEAAATMIRHALRQLSLPQQRVLDYLTRFRGAMSQAAAAARGGSIPAEALPEVHEVTLGAGALADLSLGEARVRERFGVTVVLVERQGGEAVLNPSADTRLRPGDRLRVFGLPEQVEAFRLEAGRAV